MKYDYLARDGRKEPFCIESLFKCVCLHKCGYVYVSARCTDESVPQNLGGGHMRNGSIDNHLRHAKDNYDDHDHDHDHHGFRKDTSYTALKQYEIFPILLRSSKYNLSFFSDR